MNDRFQSESKFRNVFRKYYPQALFYATRLVGNSDAEDVVQDAFIEVWKRKKEIVSEEYIRAFLFRTIYTYSLNILKHRTITQNYAESMQAINIKKAEYYRPENNDAIKLIENIELHNEIKIAINELPNKCRQVFIMSYIHEMKNKEIADILNISVKTVEVHIYKALKYLRKRLDYLILLLFTFILNQ
ncbi:MAG: RNA polymerase sigma-70 factor [Bacteroidales bacterium]|nr:RNA polymerase sigma-70 factor [Bacteroidales bacterium]